MEMGGYPRVLFDRGGCIGMQALCFRSNLTYLTLPMIRVPSDSSYLLPAGRMLTYPRLMLAVGAGGFITFILKTGKGGLTPLPPLSFFTSDVMGRREYMWRNPSW